jgi:hypothetical protein
MTKTVRISRETAPNCRFSGKLHNRLAAIERFSQNSLLLSYLKGAILCYNRYIIVELKGVIGVCKR